MANHAKKNKRPAAKKGTFGRLFRYLFDHYGMRLIVVMLCIVISAVASVVATVFLQRLIDECIVPGISSSMGAVQNLLVHILLTMAVFYVLGVLAAFTYNRIMATVTQGTLKHLRDDMFHCMETLPIPYFDTHPHGDIMSTYTNDTDAIRMLIGQSLPMLTQSVLSVLAMLGMMLYFSVWMTILVLVFIGVMLTISKKFGGASAKYMMAQQRSLATEEGFVEEIMSGQKVVQVFCHEEESKQDFVKLNEKLFHDGEKANQYGNENEEHRQHRRNVLNAVGIIAIVGVADVVVPCPNVPFRFFQICQLFLVVGKLCPCVCQLFVGVCFLCSIFCPTVLQRLLTVF